MKKIIALVLTLVLSTMALVGCVVRIPDGITGKDASKILLAKERLSDTVFSNPDGIFESGAQDFANLWHIADENFTNIQYATSQNEILTLSLDTASTDVAVASANLNCGDGSFVEVNGNFYSWYNLSEYSNSYDYFLNITNNVKSSAETGAYLIDNMKQRVRVVNTWVSYYEDNFYLTVDENSETLINYDTKHNEIRICKRYKRADGENVYELFVGSDSVNSRMVYIPGEQFYYSNESLTSDFSHNFFAENTKGYWEIVDIGNLQISCMILKDGICYDAVYDTSFGEIIDVTFMSPDKTTDILTFRDSSDSATIGLYLQAFSGIDRIEVECKNENLYPTEDFINENAYLIYSNDRGKTTYATTGRVSPYVVLKNGTVLKEGDFHLDGKIKIERTDVNHVSKEINGDGYFAQLNLTVSGGTLKERIKNLNDFLSYMGLQSKKDISALESNVNQAYAELVQFVKYKNWNDSPITTEESVNQGRKNNQAKYEEFRAMYENIKNEEVIKHTDTAKLSSKMLFTPIITKSVAKASYGAGIFSISDFTLTVDDTLLFVEGEPYVVKFAFIGIGENEAEGLRIVEAEATESFVYQGNADSFSVKGSAEFKLPELAHGSYTLVAYISTEDGIRSSGYDTVVFTDVNTESFKQGGAIVSVIKNQKNELAITFGHNSEILYSISGIKLSYTDMLSFLEERAYEYGYSYDNATIEVKNQSGEWVSLSGNESELSFGLYRLRYEIRNSGNSSFGYVIADYKQ